MASRLGVPYLESALGVLSPDVVPGLGISHPHLESGLKICSVDLKFGLGCLNLGLLGMWTWSPDIKLGV